MQSMHNSTDGRVKTILKKYIFFLALRTTAIHNHISFLSIVTPKSLKVGFRQIYNISDYVKPT